MSGPYYVEVLTRNGDVRRRERFAQLPLRIGRGYDNDVILDDAQVAARHAVIEQAGDALVVRSADDVQRIGHRGRQVAHVMLDGDTVFRLGHVSLRLRTADYDVTTLPARAPSRWDGWMPACAGLVLLVLVGLWSTWATDTEDIDPGRYAIGLAGVSALVLVWCGLWALANRLFASRMRFGRHLFVAAIGLLVIEVVSLAMTTFAYSLSLEALSRYGSHVLIATGLGVIFFHLDTVNPAHRRSFAITCVALVVLGSAIRLAFNQQNSGQFADELYMGEVMPPVPRLAGSGSIDSFFEAAKPLQGRVDAARLEKVRPDESEGM